MSTNNILATMAALADADTVSPYAKVRDLLKALSNVPQVYHTEVLGTGIAQDVATPGTPRFVIVANENTGVFGIKFEGFATDTAIKVSAVPTVAMAADMITIATDKITIGVDADLNTAHQLHVFAIIGHS